MRSDGITVVLGSQWGDEGKGKIVDVLSKEVDVVVRTGGGSNAGHTVVIDDLKYKLHLIPSGVLYDNVECFLGNGVVVHLPSFLGEIEALEKSGINCRRRIFISDRAHLLFDFHQFIDETNEEIQGDSKIGTTRKGIGPCYSTKADRIGLRVGDLLDFEETFVPRFRSLVQILKSKYGPSLLVDEDCELEKYRGYTDLIRGYIIDGIVYINKVIESNKKIMIEGANAAMLDLDFGTYPFVTSSNPTIGGCITGVGVPINKIGDILGIVKAYTTRVGSGPFPTELECHEKNSVGYHLLHNGSEYGTTTGRPRRCGWLDLVQLKYSAKINGYTYLALTKLDVLSGIEEIKIAINYIHNGNALNSFPSNLLTLKNIQVEYETLPGWDRPLSGLKSFEELPCEAKKFLEFIESQINIPIKFIGIGASRSAIIVK